MVNYYGIKTITSCGLSGTVVMYLDKKYGRVKLRELLPFNKKGEIFLMPDLTESELLDGWKKYMLKL